MIKPFLWLLITIGSLVTAAYSSAADQEPKANRVCALIEKLIQDGAVAGAQVVIGESDSPLVTSSFGVCDVQTRKPVDDDTRFCIGSCSKMFAAAVLVSLAAEKVVNLDVPIDQWLEAFAAARLVGGGNASRAPTLRELLCHRAGVYSQRNRMSEEQTRWIRDFRLSLADSVKGIAAEPISVQPGSEFAYSGAGYCVLGRVAEVAAGKPFDELLQSHVCRPLKLSRTTYFPPVDDENVASGHVFADDRLSVAGLTPHLLGKQHKFALIGGSIYSPAREAAEFARMLLKKGKSQDDQEVLSKADWKEMTTLHSPRPGGGYGLGLVVISDANTGDVHSVSHGGALFGSFSHIAVDYRTRRFGVITYTGRRNREVGAALSEWVATSTTSQ